MAADDWRAQAAQNLAEAAFALQSGQIHATSTAFGTAIGYVMAAARNGDVRAAELMRVLREAVDGAETTQVLEFEPDR